MGDLQKTFQLPCITVLLRYLEQSHSLKKIVRLTSKYQVHFLVSAMVNTVGTFMSSEEMALHAEKRQLEVISTPSMLMRARKNGEETEEKLDKSEMSSAPMEYVTLMTVTI